VAVVKMMLGGHLRGISADREPVDECADRWSVREFMGSAQDEPLRGPSTMRRANKRSGLASATSTYSVAGMSVSTSIS
jgi:hypothetical protein